MKKSLIFIFTALVMGALSLTASAQAKIYTRKARLENFPTSTTKIVTGDGFIDAALKEEVSVHWRVSAYEFCTQEEYGRDKTRSDLYFLTLTKADGINFLTLSKGGKENETDDLKKPFDIVSMPIASADDPSGQELVYMGAFLDIIQAFVEDAMNNDRVGYSGLQTYNNSNLKGRQIYLDPEQAEEHYLAETPNAVVGICLAPVNISFKTSCYRMLISTDSHELLYFKKFKFKDPKDTAFSDSEVKQFQNRHGVVSR